ncbi:hypothetical protein KPSA3_05294 [Pseudomonas syringae pv. actinidiae]|uniref:Uncharacterized protein n=1 Tax=Pseudomonas syringae pv. actinidiae TaxID=103796 RepID=A0AAN4Q8K3_PSESF|nr:hypothetical protein KPSA3_05294 [Pseudomonas syringae pv. actinidiae]
MPDLTEAPRKRGLEAGKKRLFTRLSTIIVDNLVPALVSIARRGRRGFVYRERFAEREWV